MDLGSSFNSFPCSLWFFFFSLQLFNQRIPKPEEQCTKWECFWFSDLILLMTFPPIWGGSNSNLPALKTKPLLALIRPTQRFYQKITRKRIVWKAESSKRPGKHARRKDTYKFVTSCVPAGDSCSQVGLHQLSDFLRCSKLCLGILWEFSSLFLWPLPSSCSIPGSAGLSIPPAHTICLLTPGVPESLCPLSLFPQTQEQNFPPQEISAAPDFLKEHNNGKKEGQAMIHRYMITFNRALFMHTFYFSLVEWVPCSIQIKHNFWQSLNIARIQNSEGNIPFRIIYRSCEKSLLPLAP